MNAPARTPTIIGTIAKNRNDTLRIALDTFNGTELVDVRLFYDDDGTLKPTKKGVSLRVELLPELINLLRQAEAEARRQGVLT